MGLDHTEPIESWASQEKLLEKVFPLIEDRHFLVIHCREMDADCGTEAFVLLLHFMKKMVRSFQPIHLYCFTGNRYVLGRWLEVFLRTYFSFTNLARTFKANQITALCNIGLNIFISDQFIQYNTIVNHTNIRIRTEAKAYQVLLHSRNIEDRRLLLESDAPYFPVWGCRVRTLSPSQIFVAAEPIVTHRGLTVYHVLEVTKENAQHLYNSQQ